jgi:hypothetical protein
MMTAEGPMDRALEKGMFMCRLPRRVFFGILTVECCPGGLELASHLCLFALWLVLLNKKTHHDGSLPSF